METKDLKDLTNEELYRFSRLLNLEYAKFKASDKKDLTEAKEYIKLFKEVLEELRKRKEK